MDATTFGMNDGRFCATCPCCETSYSGFAQAGDMRCVDCGCHFYYKPPRTRNWLAVLGAVLVGCLEIMSHMLEAIIQMLKAVL